jgi:hypothetical protein
VNDRLVGPIANQFRHNLSPRNAVRVLGLTDPCCREADDVWISKIQKGEVPTVPVAEPSQRPICREFQQSAPSNRSMALFLVGPIRPDFTPAMTEPLVIVGAGMAAARLVRGARPTPRSASRTHSRLRTRARTGHQQGRRMPCLPGQARHQGSRTAMPTGASGRQSHQHQLTHLRVGGTVFY